MSRIQKSFLIGVVLMSGACGAPTVVAQEVPGVAPTGQTATFGEAEHFKTVCSIAVKDLDAGVSIYIEEGWQVVSCSPYVTQQTGAPAPIIGHCCYLSR